MDGIAQRLREGRRKAGLTQAELSRLADVSLATVQNVEAGRANPSWQVLSGLLAPVGLALECRRLAPDWDLLCVLGLPLSPQRVVNARPSGPLLLAQLRLAALELEGDVPDPDRARKVEAVQALLFSLRAHFPTFFRGQVEKSPLLCALVPREPSGRIIRLSRVVVGILAEYL